MKVSFRKWSIAVLLFLIMCSLGMIFYAKDIKILGAENFITGPRFYPIMLACLIILFSVISLVHTLREPDHNVELPNVMRPVITLIIITAWAVLWKVVGYFYLLSIISMFLLIIYLNPEAMGIRKIAKAFLLDLVIVGIVYILFAVILRVNF